MAEAYIDIADVSKIYRMRKEQVEAVKNANLKIGKGEFISIVGPSGCGKSTLLMMLSGLTTVSKGSIRVNGKVVDKPRTDQGIVFQRDLLLPWQTVNDNILMPAKIRHVKGKEMERMRERTAELVKSVGLSDFKFKYPDELSGGMRQRVAICRALIMDPDLLLMDEPFAALDALTRDQMSVDLQHIWLKNQKTVLFITHSIPEAVFLSDRVVVMSLRPGKIIADISIKIPRPRRLAVYDSEVFALYTKQIRDLFEKTGILHDEG